MFPEPFEYARPPELPERAFSDEQGRMTDEFLAWLDSLPTREETTVEERIRAAIQEAYEEATDTYALASAEYAAFELAAKRVMALFRPYQDALERVAPAEAEALDHARKQG